MGSGWGGGAQTMLVRLGEVALNTALQGKHIDVQGLEELSKTPRPVFQSIDPRFSNLQGTETSIIKAKIPVLKAFGLGVQGIETRASRHEEVIFKT